MSWPIALVISVALLVMGTLAFVGADTSDLMLILVSLLGGMGASELRGLRENTNGNQSRVLDELAETRRALTRAAGVPAAEPPPPPDPPGA